VGASAVRSLPKSSSTEYSRTAFAEYSLGHSECSRAAFKERRADGIVKCIADEMGGDPLEGMPKMCLCLSGA
jgi:hypothetical protein